MCATLPETPGSGFPRQEQQNQTEAGNKSKSLQSVSNNSSNS